MSKGRTKILHVALAVPLRRHFDYISTDTAVKPGMRVEVPFGKSGKRTGVVVGLSDESGIPKTRLKKINQVLDTSPLYPASHFALLQWASDYYQHPIGEVFLNTLPAFLKQGKAARLNRPQGWKLTAEGQGYDAAQLTRAPVQKAIIELLGRHPEGAGRDRFPDKNMQPALKALEKKGLIEKFEYDNAVTVDHGPTNPVSLNPEQRQAASAIIAGLGRYGSHLLYGLTGSGKTEVYINVIREVISRGRQALVLVPEIGLTPQLVHRFKDQIGSAGLVVLHSGLADGERFESWLRAREGKARLILGTRSAIWTPLESPGVIIIDEEHDPSYKQQDGFRYSARDIAIMRANMENIPVVLGSATPSMASMHNVIKQKFTEHRLSQRAEMAEPPEMQIIDLRHQKMSGAFSSSLLSAIAGELEKKHPVLLFLNKRGYSPVLMCHHCGWISQCKRCDVRLTYHKFENKLGCHHCGSYSPVPSHCPDCGEMEMIQIGHGTERLAETLAEIHPDARIMRIDRDSTRRKGALQTMFDKIMGGEADILIGTQMLAKGHNFPSLDLVGIIDADRGLFSVDFRASEQMAQLITQVSGRAGRSSRKGRVLLQTHYPDHPLLKSLVTSGYDAFAKQLLDERRITDLPPYSFQVLLRSEDYEDNTSIAFLNESKSLLDGKHRDIEIFGPYAAPMEKRAGRKRYQLLLQTSNRQHFKTALTSWSRTLETLNSGKKVRWSLDVDPMDMI